MVQDGFNTTMIWDKFISDVEHQSGQLFTGTTRDTLMTRQDILNMYNDLKRKEYVKHQSDPTSVDCWYNIQISFFSTNNKMLCKMFHLSLVYKLVGCAQ